MEKKLSIILPTMNRLNNLKNAINSISKFIKFDYDLIVVDGQSTDGTHEYLQGVSNCNLIIRKPMGVRDANNWGLSQVKTPYVVFMSDDLVLLKDNFSLGIEILEENSNTGLIGLKIRERVLSGKNIGDKLYAGAVSNFGILTINFPLINVNLIREIGGFSQNYVTYVAETDLTLKILLSGYKISHIKSITADHLVYSEIDKEPAFKSEDMMIGGKVYLEKYSFLPTHSSLDDSLKSKFKKNIRTILLNLLFFRRKKMLGYFRSDIWNTWRSKYVNNLDPIINLTKKYHLVQKLPDKLISENFEKIKEIIGG